MRTPLLAGGGLSHRGGGWLGGGTEWLMVADCKSAGLTPYVGSNPTPTMQGSGAAGRRGRTMRVSMAPEVVSETGADCPAAPLITAPPKTRGLLRWWSI